MVERLNNTHREMFGLTDDVSSEETIAWLTRKYVTGEIEIDEYEERVAKQLGVDPTADIQRLAREIKRS